MAIKYNGQDISKRIINGVEVEKVMKNWVQIRPESTPVSDDYLCFTANENNCTIALIKHWYLQSPSLETSRDKEHWMDYIVWDELRLISAWDKLYWRSKSSVPTGFSSGITWYTFSMSWSIGASWDINFLLCKNSTIDLTQSGSNEHIYYGLFDHCTSLTTAPRLPALVLSESCYRIMFRWCTALTISPELPANTLTKNCYSYMFDGCTSLTTAQQISATTLAEQCCSNMFRWCTSLITLPRLPATNMEKMCYAGMFNRCSLIKLSEQQTQEYTTPYRIPSSWTWEPAEDALSSMFYGTWWAFVWTPWLNTTYYTSNTVI